MTNTNVKIKNSAIILSNIQIVLNGVSRQTCHLLDVSVPMNPNGTGEDLFGAYEIYAIILYARLLDEKPEYK